MDESANKDNRNEEHNENITTVKIASTESNENQFQNVTKQAENYLISVSDFISQSYDPKLKREQQKLNDLLASYRNLCEKFKKNNAGEINLTSELDKHPEIYAILHPELYEDVRNTKKHKLASHQARKPFFTKSVTPNCKTPVTHNLYDLRQKEKDRFSRLIASAPVSYNNFLPPGGVIRRSLPHSQDKLKLEENIREKEKDRLAKILASSSTRRNVRPGPRKTNEISKKSDVQSSKKEKGLIQQVAGNQNNRDSKLEERLPANPDKNRQMTKPKEDKQFGVEEPQKVNPPRSLKLVQAPESYKTLDTPGSCKSASTQTDEVNFSSSIAPLQPSRLQMENVSEEVQTSPLSHLAFVSPKEKLIYDLQGTSHMNPKNKHNLATIEDDYRERRFRQIAYAEALREQIEEKKRLEEEKKRKEKEQEEMIEKKAREQQERLQQEYSKEQIQRQDWLMQRAAQEEALRHRLLEMELEAQQLRKQENDKKRHSNSSNTPNIPGRFSRKPQTISSAVDPLESTEFHAELSRSPQPPLLVQDTQNILNAREFRGEIVPKEVVLPPAHIYGGSEEERRPPSPVVPAVRTESLMKRNSRLLDDKWKVPESTKTPPVVENSLIWGSSNNEDIRRGLTTGIESYRRADNILTQLGAFRRQLQLEHIRMQQRLENSNEILS